MRRRRDTASSCWSATKPYYSRVGFKAIPKGHVTMPGPVDHSRLLVVELVEGASEGVSGAVRPDWSKAK